MLQRVFFIVFLVFFSSYSSGQTRFLTKTGVVTFFSSTPLEDIQAKTKDVASIIDTESGKIAIAISMKSFQFERKLMQEHFNENYVESDKYPKAIFQGVIEGFNDIDTSPIKRIVSGTLDLHGVKKEMNIEAEFARTKGEITTTGQFFIKLEDFNIKIPKIVFKKIAEEIQVDFNFNHTPYQK